MTNILMEDSVADQEIAKKKRRHKSIPRIFRPVGSFETAADDVANWEIIFTDYNMTKPHTKKRNKTFKLN